jgi:hypothetical protein
MRAMDAWDLADYVERHCDVALSSVARDVLVDLLVDLIDLLTYWPTGCRPSSPLQYLRRETHRMARFAPWLYELPSPLRQTLIGTARVSSLLETAMLERDPSRDQIRRWRSGLSALQDMVGRRAA